MALKVAEKCGLRPVIVCPKNFNTCLEEMGSEFFPMFKPVVFNYESLTRGKEG